MKSTACIFLALSLLALAAGLAAAQGDGDRDAVLLRERSEKPASPAPAFGPLPAAAGPGHRLFYRTGPDNGVCIRAVPDVTGDGRDEVVVGFDESGVDNIFCLDGSSSGVATDVWAIQTADGVSGGSPYGDQCLVTISDTDGNGYANILAGTAWGGRTAYNLDAFDGSIAWKLDTYTTPASGWVYSLCEMSDIDGDSVPEAAFGTGSDSNSVYLVDGASTGAATVRWRWSAPDAVYTVRNIGDVNGDGHDDVLAAVGDDGDRIVCLSGGTTNPNGQILWQHIPSISVYACGVHADITGDGIREAIAVYWTLGGDAIRVLNGATGLTVWTSTAVGDYGMMVDSLEDVTGDGVPEIVVASWENAVTVLDGLDGSLVWKTVVGTTNGGDVWTARAVDDLNGDGRQDVIAGSFDYHVYAMDGDSGEVFWAYDTGNRVFSVAPVGDLNDDGRPEVAAATQDTQNTVLAHVFEGDADIPYPGLTLTGPGSIDSDLVVEVIGNAGWKAIVGASRQTASIPKPPYEGILGIQPPGKLVTKGTIPPEGAYLDTVHIPNRANLVGKTFYFQGLVRRLDPLEGAFTDVESLSIVN
jgi:hypothetical protein